MVGRNKLYDKKKRDDRSQPGYHVEHRLIYYNVQPLCTSRKHAQGVFVSARNHFFFKNPDSTLLSYICEDAWDYGEIVIGLASGAHQFTLSRELVGFVLYTGDSRMIDVSIKPEKMENINNLKEQEVEILIIEDNPGDAELTIRAPKKSHVANHIVHLVDGAEALDFLFGTGEYSNRNLDNLPKVILLDLKMPKVDGLEVLRHLKSDLRTKMIPVVILTSSAKDPDIKKCYDLGANSYIVKPVEINNFVKTISEIGMYWLLIDKGGLQTTSSTDAT